MHVSKLSCCWCIISCIVYCWLHTEILHLVVILMHHDSSVGLTLSGRRYHSCLNIRAYMGISLICNSSTNIHPTDDFCRGNILTQRIKLIVAYRLIKLYNFVSFNAFNLVWQHTQLISLYIVTLFYIILLRANHSSIRSFSHAIHNLLGTLIL